MPVFLLLAGLVVIYIAGRYALIQIAGGSIIYLIPPLSQYAGPMGQSSLLSALMAVVLMYVFVLGSRIFFHNKARATESFFSLFKPAIKSAFFRTITYLYLFFLVFAAWAALFGPDNASMYSAIIVAGGSALYSFLISSFGTSKAPLRSGPQLGQIWWADIPFSDVDDSKDRPCLVLSETQGVYEVLMLTSQEKRKGQRGYLTVPVPKKMQKDGKSESFLKTDRLIHINRSSFRSFAWQADDATRDAVSRVYPSAFTLRAPVSA